MRGLWIIALFISIGCSEKKNAVSCDDSMVNVDPEFCNDFRNAMLSFQQMDDSTNAYYRTHAMIFLVAITEIPSQANDLHHPFYDSEKELQDDLEKWSEWFETNKGKWTKRRADSVFHKYNGG